MKKFTLIELLLVVAIIGILASLLIPGLSKARLKARAAVCKSNLKNISLATTLYQEDNNEYYPSFSGLDSSISENNGTHWFGQKGTQAKHAMDVTERPVNTYLGHDSDGEEVPVANCPIAESNGYKYFSQKGCYYHGVQRKETADDLDSDEGSLRSSDIYNTSTMAAIVEKDYYIWIFEPSSQYLRFNHEPGNPRFVAAFVDGHIAENNVISGEGYQFKSSRINLINFE
ncbi:6-phosphogluconolactonase [Lentisphaera araneosa HTCC2155]|uniref:6-phosphogluconolactonase n=1 Tax=Lentisphaera araneosa HTCC2155 TaxID=313628 RepID=A6DQU8_9BACT|nr:type II secretion system protein [Lentisphaera araneosa]EDM25998.1 6-phosphogluconolactonase [Lentisphaera araneosa HTCC2155]